jgi:hypothetical protein
VGVIEWICGLLHIIQEEISFRREERCERLRRHAALDETLEPVSGRGA